MLIFSTFGKPLYSSTDGNLSPTLAKHLLKEIELVADVLPILQLLLAATVVTNRCIILNLDG